MNFSSICPTKKKKKCNKVTRTSSRQLGKYCNRNNSREIQQNLQAPQKTYLLTQEKKDLIDL